MRCYNQHDVMWLIIGKWNITAQERGHTKCQKIPSSQQQPGVQTQSIHSRNKMENKKTWPMSGRPKRALELPVGSDKRFFFLLAR